MARRASATTLDTTGRPAKAPRRFFEALKTLCNWTVAICLILFAIWGAWEIEHVLITDKRFTLEGPPEPGVASASFLVEGVRYASESQISDVFRRDFGRSIYLCPIQERRLKLLAIDWIKQASVSRIWPNRIFVKVVERIPVAFVQLPAANGSMAYGLVDSEGIMLDPQRAAKLTLPVLAGVATRSDPRRKEQIRRFSRLQTELGPMMEGISEIDVSDTHNLRVTVAYNGRAIALMLGDRDFQSRYRTFADHKQEVMEVVPNARVLDLRLRGRFTAVVTEEPVARAASNRPARTKKEPKR
jgi:cell division protein FtsQ